jgi:rubrerythrin
MDALEFAVNMELAGLKYYQQQAQANQDNPLHVIFSMLADDERAHADILRKHAEGQAYTLTESQDYERAKDVFADLEDFRSEIKTLPTPTDSYRLGLDIERKSIEFYEEMRKDARSEEEKALFDYLIGQEEEHHAIMEELVVLVDRAESWVESAEFGRREEY